ncbi:MAG: DUF134 domain-containing protein [Ruminococcus sp.]|nr:DUF134 domain-containing protein [Ruminococcus sp.]
MARPTRCRRICFEPKYDSFAPCGSERPEQVFLAVDEFETIRLVDHERRTHEQCAKQMGISRTTVTEMYERARSKIADCLINGKTLCISGGNYALCDGSAWRCCGKKCSRAGQEPNLKGRARPKEEENRKMKIAVTYQNGNVFQHFGHTEQFKVFEIQDGKIAEAQVVDTNGNGHGALAGMLSSLNVDTLICGGIGAGAQNALAEAGIRLYGGVSGSADAAVEALLAGNLSFDPNVHCSHHGHHGESHNCGEDTHGCGSHNCTGNGGF